MVPYIYEAALFYWLASNARTVMSGPGAISLVCSELRQCSQFTGQRGQMISHDHAPLLECSDCQYQTFVACVPLSTKLNVGIQSPDSF